MSEPTPMHLLYEVQAILGGIHHRLTQLSEWAFRLEQRIEKLEDPNAYAPHTFGLDDDS